MTRLSEGRGGNGRPHSGAIFHSRLIENLISRVPYRHYAKADLLGLLRCWFTEFAMHIANERGIVLRPSNLGERLDELSELLEPAMLNPAATTLTQYRRVVLAQDISDGDQFGKLAAVAMLCRIGEVADQAKMCVCGEVVSFRELRRHKFKTHPQQHPRFTFVERYIATMDNVGASRLDERRAIGTFLWWLCRLRNIRYAINNETELLDALRVLKRDDLVLYRISRSRSRGLNASLKRRQRLMAISLRFLPWLFRDQKWRGRPWRDVPHVQEEPRRHPSPERAPIALFERFLASQSVGDNTKTNYRSLIWGFFSWFAALKNIPVEVTPFDAVLAAFERALLQISTSEVLAFRDYLRLGASKVARPKKIRIFKMLQRFYAFLEGRGEITAGTVTRVEHLHASEITRQGDHSGDLPSNVKLAGTRRPHLSLLEEFLQSRKLAPKTVREYRNVLWSFFWWLAEEGGIMISVRSTRAAIASFEATVKETSVTDIANYRKRLLDPGTKGAIRQKCLKFQVVKTFFAWLATSEQIRRDPTKSFEQLVADDFATRVA